MEDSKASFGQAQKWLGLVAQAGFDGQRLQRFIARFGAMAQIERAIEEGRLTNAEVLAFATQMKKREKVVEQPPASIIAPSDNIVVVPHIAAVDLTALLMEERDFTCSDLDPDYAYWNYYRAIDGKPISGQGKRFEVLVWKPKLAPWATIASNSVRRHFRRFGFYGHTGAFIQWLRIRGFTGYHASILDDNNCLLDRHNCHCSLSAYSVHHNRQIIRQIVPRPHIHEWRCGWSFVGFREIKE
ncbi:MAG: hypothetical protein Q7R83_04915 [bacterium]|nr:hypothetical protein [bacterium]